MSYCLKIYTAPEAMERDAQCFSVWCILLQRKLYILLQSTLPVFWLLWLSVLFLCRGNYIYIFTWVTRLVLSFPSPWVVLPPYIFSVQSVSCRQLTPKLHSDWFFCFSVFFCFLRLPQLKYKSHQLIFWNLLIMLFFSICCLCDQLFIESADFWEFADSVISGFWNKLIFWNQLMI